MGDPVLDRQRQAAADHLYVKVVSMSNNPQNACFR
jgi:hypothetical protein